LAPAGVPGIDHTIITPDPFDANAVIKQMPASADESGKQVTPILVFSSAPFSEDDETLRYVLVSYAASGDCHACSVTLSVAVFAKRESNWILKSWDASLMTFGGWGVLGGKAEEFSLGDHSGAILQGSGGGQGEIDSYATVLGESGGKLTAVWGGPTGLDETGTGNCDANSCANWSSVLKRLPTSKNGWADLQLLTTGVGDRSDKSFGSMNQTQTLQFDGSKYVVTSTAIDPLAAQGVPPSQTADDSTLPNVPAATASTAIPSSAQAELRKVIDNPSGPSFDCSIVTNITAKAICGNAQLSQLDRQMAILYYTHTNYGTDPAARDQQTAWIHSRNDSCVADVVCLKDQFNQRIKQLQ